MPCFRVNPPPVGPWQERGRMVITGRRAGIHFDPGRGAPSIKTVLEGAASWQTPEGRYEVSPETFLVLNADQEYSLESSGARPVQTFCVFFLPEDLAEAGLAAGLRGLTGFYERLQLLNPALIAALDNMRSVVGARDSDDLEGDCAYAEILMALVCSESSTAEKAGIKSARPAVREELYRQLNRARDYALSNLTKALTLAELSDAATMSPFHFHRLHRQAFGETPHAFVTRARIARAGRLLKEGLDTEEVAFSLGFASGPSFWRLFKVHTGLTPGQYRS